MLLLLYYSACMVNLFAFVTSLRFGFYLCAYIQLYMYSKGFRNHCRPAVEP
jgi:hypothetical protein